MFVLIVNNFDKLMEVRFEDFMWTHTTLYSCLNRAERRYMTERCVDRIRGTRDEYSAQNAQNVLIAVEARAVRMYPDLPPEPPAPKPRLYTNAKKAMKRA
ncbi:hypothetical protein C5167_019047 [Papaver somniferum]|uniref:Uncharacterized protein n=1 Tax=Papaver somniferum TaxID=3469 RepID=A0A4Y7IP21_PAPSO|nr:hypothetical protein C5167_019047 [Papaver somniferum]